MKKKNYKPRTVVAAQKRVLDMVARVVSQLTPQTRSTLRADAPAGYITIDEVLDQVEQARDLKIDWGK